MSKRNPNMMAIQYIPKVDGKKAMHRVKQKKVPNLNQKQLLPMGIKIRIGLPAVAMKNPGEKKTINKNVDEIVSE